MVSQFYNQRPDQARFFTSCNMAVPSDIFRTLGGFDGQLRTAEDRELCDRWLAKGFKLYYVPQAKVSHFHTLGFSSFCHQHFNYGRGAYYFHKIRYIRKSGTLLNEFCFYLSLFKHIRPMFQSGILHAIKLTAILMLWQAANAAGFFYELWLSLRKML